MDTCAFCNIAKKKTPSYTVYEDDYLVAILDINPSIPGHMILILKSHYSSLKEINDDELGHLFIISKKLSSVLMKAINLKGVSLFIADGTIAGQKAPHTLLHIIPRFDNDKINLKIIENSYDENKIDGIRKQILSNIEYEFNIQKDIIMSWEGITANDNGNKNSNSNNCFICNLLKSQSKPLIVYMDDEVIAYMDRTGISPYHIKITTIRHYPIIDQIPDDITAKMINIAKKLSMVIAKTFNINSSNIILNNGIPAGQQYPHVILNLIPRISGDNIALNWEPKKCDNDLLADLALSIKGLADNTMNIETKKEESKYDKVTELKNDTDEKDYLIDSLNRRC